MAGVRKDLTRSLYLYGTAVLVLFGALMAGIMNGNESRHIRRGLDERLIGLADRSAALLEQALAYQPGEMARLAAPGGASAETTAALDRMLSTSRTEADLAEIAVVGGNGAVLWSSRPATAIGSPLSGLGGGGGTMRAPAPRRSRSTASSHARRS